MRHETQEMLKTAVEAEAAVEKKEAEQQAQGGGRRRRRSEREEEGRVCRRRHVHSKGS